MFGLGAKKKTIIVDGMTCHHCEMTVEKAVLEIPGVKSAKADFSKGNVEVQFREDLDVGKVKQKIEQAGYRFVSTN